MLAIYRHPPYVTPSQISSAEDDSSQSSEKELASDNPAPASSASKVALVWYNRPIIGSHIAIAIDDTLYGFCLGKPTKESPSLYGSCRKRMENKDFMTVVQEIKVSSSESDAIKTLCQKDFLPSTTCMGAASEVLKAVDIHIPFPISLQPDVSRYYLDQLDHPRLFKQVSYGTLRFPNIGLITQTFILLGYCYFLPRLFLGNKWGQPVGEISLIIMSCLQARAFCLIGKKGSIARNKLEIKN